MSIRRCCVCQQPIEHLAAARTTCGHPRCQRANRGRPRRKPPERSVHVAIARAKAAAMSADEKGRARITQLMDDALAAGIDTTTAAVMTAKATGETVATVLSTYRAGLR